MRALRDAMLPSPDVHRSASPAEAVFVALAQPEAPVLPAAPGEPGRPLAEDWRLDIAGFCERLAPLMDDADNVLLLWGGGGFNRLVVGGGPEFDFVMPDGVAPAPRTMLLPYSAIEEWAEGVFEGGAVGAPFSTFWDALEPYPQSRKVAFLMPPPPLPMKAVRERLAAHPNVIERARQLEVDLYAMRLASDAIRRKASAVVRRAYERAAERCGRMLIPPPDEALTADGMLAPQFWGSDATHANTRYGRLYLEKAVEALTEADAESLAASV
jgi:hypothetical protein